MGPYAKSRSSRESTVTARQGVSSNHDGGTYGPHGTSGDDNPDHPAVIFTPLVARGRYADARKKAARYCGDRHLRQKTSLLCNVSEKMMPSLEGIDLSKRDFDELEKTR